MKIKCAAFLIGLMLFQTDAFADIGTGEQPPHEKLYEGSLLISTGIKRGTLHEYAFSDGRKISRLDWQMRNCIYSGFSVDLTCINKIWFSGNFAYGLNNQMGSMDDYDWNSTGSVSSYSHHSCVLEKAFFLDLSAGWVAYKSSAMRVIPFACVNMYDIKMTAHNGYSRNPYKSDPVEINGTVLAYRQRYLIPEIGVRLDYTLQKYTFAAWGGYGRWGSCRAEDNHFLRSLDFYDTINNVQKIDAGISADYIFSEKFTVRLKTSYTYIPLSKGSSYNINTFTGLKTISADNSAGVKMDIWDMHLAAGTVF